MQGLASVDEIKRLVRWLGLDGVRNYLDHLTDEEIATVQGFVSTMILALFQVALIRT